MVTTPDRTRPIVASPGRNGLCSSKATACRLASFWQERTGTIPRCCGPRWSVCPGSGSSCPSAFGSILIPVMIRRSLATCGRSSDADGRSLPKGLLSRSTIRAGRRSSGRTPGTLADSDSCRWSSIGLIESNKRGRIWRMRSLSSNACYRCHGLSIGGLPGPSSVMTGGDSLSAQPLKEVFVAFIDENKHRWGIKPICQVLRHGPGTNIAPSTCYAFKNRPTNAGIQRDAEPKEGDMAIHTHHRSKVLFCGIRKIHAELQRTLGRPWLGAQSRGCAEIWMFAVLFGGIFHGRRSPVPRRNDWLS